MYENNRSPKVSQILTLPLYLLDERNVACSCENSTAEALAFAKRKLICSPNFSVVNRITHIVNRSTEWQQHGCSVVCDIQKVDVEDEGKTECSQRG